LCSIEEQEGGFDDTVAEEERVCVKKPVVKEIETDTTRTFSDAVLRLMRTSPFGLQIR
jgi:hypothetical protein